MTILNINDIWGDSVEMKDVEEFENLIIASGYELPEDGLAEGVDYEVLKESTVKMIKEAASHLDNGWIILNALEDDKTPDEAVYLETVNKIKKIEEKYTQEEIKENNLLCDIW